MAEGAVGAQSFRVLLLVLVVAFALLCAWKGTGPVVGGAVGALALAAADRPGIERFIVGGGRRRPQPKGYDDKETCLARRQWFPNRKAVWKYIGGVRDWAEAKARIVDTWTPVERKTGDVSVLGGLPSVKRRVARFRNGPEALERTLRWFYNSHKVGLFVRIRGGQLEEFCAFNNPAYRNPMAEELGRMGEKGPEKQEQLARALSDRPVMWCQYWPQEGGHWKRTGKKEKLPAYFNEFLWWWETAAKERDLGDCDLFLNYKDQLVAPEPGKSPHPQLPESAQALGARTGDTAKAFVPVLSQSTAEGFEDVPFVTADDINRTSGICFPPSCFSHYFGLVEQEPVEWSDRDPRALFRGSATGCGTTAATNPRLEARDLGRSRPDLLDVGITSARSALKHYYAEGALQPRPKKGGPADRVAFSDHGKYRALLDIDGNVLAYRVAALFSFGSVVVRFRPGFQPWFGDLLRPDPSDEESNCRAVRSGDELVKVLEALAASPERAESVGARGRALFLDRLQKKNLLDYTEALTHAFSGLASTP
jgi:hypothetical protein